jgi:hypothetical protein
MPDLHNDDTGVGGVDGIHDAVVALAETVLLFSGQLLSAWRAGIESELADSSDKPPTFFARQDFEFLRGRRLDPKAIACHAASGP